MELLFQDIVLFLMGLGVSIKIILHLYSCFVFAMRCHFIRWCQKIDLVEAYGSWAVITGASSGIGLGIVKQFAKHGLNIVLISRGQEKLRKISSDIEKEYGVKTEIIAIEATDRKSYSYIIEKLSGLDVSIFVNNVGIIAEERNRMMSFHEIRPERVYDMTTVNCGATTILMKGILPRMIKRNKGLIINMSSITTYEPNPYQALYSANKKYMDILTDSIKDEIKSTKILIKLIRPFVVKTKMTSINHIAYSNDIIAQTPDEFARHLIPTLSHDLITCGYWFADLLIWPYNLMPDWYKRLHVGAIMNIAVKYGQVVSDEKLN